MQANIPTAAMIINNFWNQNTPGGAPWTPALIEAIYGYDAQTVQELWDWCGQQTPGMSVAQLLQLFNSTEQLVATPIGEEIEPIPLPAPSTAAIGTISEAQVFADLYAFLQSKNAKVST